jgi:hypothetical protein
LKNKIVIKENVSDLLETLDVINGLNKCDGWETIADKPELAFEHIAKLEDIVISAGDCKMMKTAVTVGATPFLW